MKTWPAELPGYPCQMFSLANPRGAGQSNVPRLLRSLAQEIEALGPDIEVVDVVFHSDVSPFPEIDEEHVNFTVYFVPRSYLDETEAPE